MIKMKTFISLIYQTNLSAVCQAALCVLCSCLCNAMATYCTIQLRVKLHLSYYVAENDNHSTDILVTRATTEK